MVDTSGYENIQISWSQRNSATASRYARLQYAADGDSFVDASVIALWTESVFTNVICDLGQKEAAADNPIFAFRIVTEFERTALGTGSDTYVATKPGSSYSGAGTMRFDMVTVSGTPIAGANTRPTISPVSMRTLRVTQTTGPIDFSVGDAEDSPETLIVTAVSSDILVIPESNIRLGGWGATRTATITAGDRPGASTITLLVTDTGGKTASTSFMVTVLRANTAPFIASIPGTNALVSTGPLALSLTIGDAETEADALNLSATSGNPRLVPNDPANLAVGGTGSNRVVRIVPAYGQTGVAPIMITAGDGANTATVAFALMIRPSADVALYDPFEYAAGSLLTNSAFLWQTRSGTSGQCQVKDGQLQITANQTEDVVASLVGEPYTRNHGTVLYARFKARILSLPKSTPGYFAHFGDGSTLRGRIYAMVSSALPGCFHLAVSNGSSTNTVLPANLSTNTTYTVVTRYNVDTAITTLWVNPKAETDPGVTATDNQQAISIGSYGFRQDTDIGATILIDDLRVGLSFTAVGPADSSNATPLTLGRTGTNLVLRWSGPSLILQSSSAATGPFADLPSATSPFTVRPTNSMQFFRLR
jgi:hypothetical protein